MTGCIIARLLLSDKDIHTDHLHCLQTLEISVTHWFFADSGAPIIIVIGTKTLNNSDIRSFVPTVSEPSYCSSFRHLDMLYQLP